MNTIEAFKTITPGQQVTTLARLLDKDGSLITAIGGIRLQIFVKDSRTPIVVTPLGGTGVVVATSTVTETLATGSGWGFDEQGFNFSHTYDTSTYLSGGVDYDLVYRITTDSLGVLFITVKLRVLSTRQDPA